MLCNGICQTPTDRLKSRVYLPYFLLKTVAEACEFEQIIHITHGDSWFASPTSLWTRPTPDSYRTNGSTTYTRNHHLFLVRSRWSSIFIFQHLRRAWSSILYRPRAGYIVYIYYVPLTYFFIIHVRQYNCTYVVSELPV